MTIDEDLLIDSVRALNAAGERANARDVSRRLGPIADDGGYWDAMTVADDLAELESRGRLRRQPAIDWGGGDLPEPRIEYVVVVDDEDT